MYSFTAKAHCYLLNMIHKLWKIKYLIEFVVLKDPNVDLISARLAFVIMAHESAPAIVSLTLIYCFYQVTRKIKHQRPVILR